MRLQHGEGVREADPLLARADAKPRCCSERTQTLVLILVITGMPFRAQLAQTTATTLAELVLISVIFCQVDSSWTRTCWLRT